MIVLDASAGVELLLRDRAVAQRLLQLVRRPEQSLHVPEMFDVEVVSALRRRVRRGEMAQARAESARSDLAAMAVTRYPHTLLLGRAWSLRDNATPYDALYLALAEALRAPLVTTDARLAAAAAEHTEAEVIHVG